MARVNTLHVRASGLSMAIKGAVAMHALQHAASWPHLSGRDVDCLRQQSYMQMQLQTVICVVVCISVSCLRRYSAFWKFNSTFKTYIGRRGSHGNHWCC
jgi:hypothetical protein